jgi:hypothetical protein
MKLFKIRSKSPFSGKEAHDLPWFIQDIIYASILGDGYLEKQYLRGDARLRLEHSEAQEGYIRWKVDMISPFLGGKVRSRTRPERPDTTFFVYDSHVQGELTDIYYNLFKKKRDEGYRLNLRLKWLNRFTVLGLMIWFFDDGHLHPRDREIVIGVHSLGEANVAKLRQYLKSAWDLDTRVEMSKQTINQKVIYYARLRFSTNQSKKFIRAIMPVIPRKCKSLLYKISMVYKQHEPQQRWISDLIRLTSFSEGEIAEFYRDKLSDKLFSKCFPNVKVIKKDLLYIQFTLTSKDIVYVLSENDIVQLLF